MNARLNIADVRRTRSHRGKMRQIDLARRFRVSQPTICQVQLRRTWKAEQ